MNDLAAAGLERTGPVGHRTLYRQQKGPQSTGVVDQYRQMPPRGYGRQGLRTPDSFRLPPSPA